MAQGNSGCHVEIKAAIIGAIIAGLFAITAAVIMIVPPMLDRNDRISTETAQERQFVKTPISRIPIFGGDYNSFGTLTPGSGHVTVKVNTTANLRSGPSTNYSQVGKAFRGKSFPILARTENNTWYLILRENGEHAWISASIVDVLMGDIQVQPISTTIQPTLLPPTATISNTPTAQASIEQAVLNVQATNVAQSVAPTPTLTLFTRLDNLNPTQAHVPEIINITTKSEKIEGPTFIESAIALVGDIIATIINAIIWIFLGFMVSQLFIVIIYLRLNKDDEDAIIFIGIIGYLIGGILQNWRVRFSIIEPDLDLILQNLTAATICSLVFLILAILLYKLSEK